MTDEKPSGMTYYTALESFTTNYYWSSTHTDYSWDYAWYVHFSDGKIDIYSKSGTRRVLCIHD